MFNGVGKGKLDQKCRVKVPKKILEQIRSVSSSRTLYVTLGFDGCLFLFTEERWKQIYEKVQGGFLTNQLSRFFDRFFFGLGEKIEPDAAGRFVIPESLRGTIDGAEEVVFAGTRNRVEIWSAEAWESFLRENRKGFETFAPGMTE